MTAKQTAPFNVKILTLFPEMFPGHLGLSLAGKALEKDLWSLETVNPRYYATDLHKTVDDAPFGGGAGMVMKPDILSNALQAHLPLGRFIYMSPRGKPLTQALAQELAGEDLLTILCGRYEGVDQRLLDAYKAEEISIGDYVLSGGEQAAMVLLDAIIRLLPGVVGNSETHDEESFSGGLLEYPHYTRPAEWTGPDGETRGVPEVLSSGHHAKIKAWRLQQSEALTRERRPDLWEKYRKKTS
ncbi:MAG: tRNA (guanosine(37)-N1)-methyltransferase TrmD [Alphaproteobacteria bacterium]|nr:tRNA (guanosine(37)-N1)-methyltransferase TrmD [Alphaproteobacteria bacterium]